MKNAEPENPQQIDDAWDDSPPSWDPSGPPPASDVMLAGPVRRTDASGGTDSLDWEVDEGWDLAQDVGSERPSCTAAVRAGDAPHREEVQPGATRSAGQRHWGLSKKERRALERQQRVHAAQRKAERKQEQKRDRERQRRAEQQARAAQPAAEPRATQKAPSSRKRAASTEEPPRAAGARKEPVATQKPRASREKPGSVDAVSAEKARRARHKKSARKARLRRASKLRARRVLWLAAVALLVSAIVIVWLKS